MVMMMKTKESLLSITVEEKKETGTGRETLPLLASLPRRTALMKIWMKMRKMTSWEMITERVNSYACLICMCFLNLNLFSNV